MILTNWPRLILFLSFILVFTVLSIPNDSKMGVIYFKSFEYDKALNYFDKAKSTNSDSPLILKKIKDYFIIQGDIQKALISQKKLTELLPKNLGHWNELVKLYNWNNMPYHALKAQVQIANLNPTKKRFKILLNIQKGYQWLRKWDDASAIGEILYKSDEPRILEENLKYYLSIADTKSVIKHIKKLETLTKNSHKYQYYLAQAYIIDDDYPKAIKSLLVSFGHDNSYENFYQSAGFLNHPLPYILKRSETLEQIINLYEKMNDDISIAKINKRLFEIDSRKYDIGLDAAETFIKHKRDKQALSILQKIYNVRSASRLYRAAQMYIELGELDDAIKYMEQSINLYPYKPIYFNDLTDLYEQSGQKRKALNLQLKLLKLLKKENTRTRFFINSSEALFAQNGITRIPSNKSTEIKNTYQKIIQLMEELGENDKKHKQLKQLNNEFPNDINAMKMLAYSYLEKDKVDQARTLFYKVNQISPLDEDAAIYVADDMLQSNKTENAYITLKPFIGRNDVKFKNRLFNIYLKLSPKAADKICQEHEVDDVNNFNQIDLKVKCNEQKKLYKDSINLLLSHLDSKPKNLYAKVLLTYQLLHDQDLKNAKKIILDLKRDGAKKETLVSLNKYVNEVILDLKIQKSWEHSLTYSNFDSSNHFFWTNTFELYRNTGKLSYGVKLLRAEPSKTDTTIGSNSVIFKYYFRDDLVTRFYFGNNFGGSNKAAYGYSVMYQWLDRVLLNYSADIATQIYDIPAFSTASEALRDNHSVFLSYNHDFRNRFTFAFNHNHFYVNDLSAKSRLASLQYNYFLTNNWSPGIFSQLQEAYEGDEEVKNLLIKKSNVLALNLRHEYIFYKKKIKNTVDLYIGQDSERDIDLGEYLSFRNTLYYDHSKRKQANFMLQWNKESQNININESIRVQLGYSFWFI